MIGLLHFRRTCTHVSFSFEWHIFTFVVRISSGPKKVFASIAHVLSCSKFEELFDLCLRDLWISPKCIGKFIVNIGIICPFTNVREFFF